jgi:hypothetical protein
MFRAVLIGLLALSFTGCGQTFVGFISNPGSPAAFTGTVSVVHLTVMDNGSGTMVNVTAVTLIEVPGVTNVNVCGDHVSQFPLNQAVRVNVTSGVPCSTLVGVVIL